MVTLRNIRLEQKMWQGERNNLSICFVFGNIFFNIKGEPKVEGIEFFNYRYL